MEDDLDIVSEHMRQREHLEHTVISLRKQLNKDTKLHHSDYTRITKQNVMLIKEINDLRQELKMARLQLNDMEKLLHTSGTDKMSDRVETQAKLQSIIQQVRDAVTEREAKLEEKTRIIEMQCKEMGHLYTQLQMDSECPSRRDGFGRSGGSGVRTGAMEQFGRLPPLPGLN